tara:strand:+ start:2483 stop:4021 length:1539 start_codon:yes stop_codon:yes gene_type:complete
MKKKRNVFLYIFLLSILFKPLWLFEINNISPSDDLSYWLHSSTIALDFDVNYIDDHNLNHYTIHPETNAPFHPPGSGYANAPFVYLFNQFDKLTNTQFDRLNPTGSFSFIGYFVGTLFYCLVAFYLLKKIINHNKYKNYEILYLIIFLSTLVHFISGRFLMAHSFEFFLCSFLIYIYETRRELNDPKNFSLLVLIYFLLSITRPSTFIYSLCLVGIYYDSFRPLKINKQNFLNLNLFILFIVFYVYLANQLYQQNTIFLNVSNSLFLNDYANLINFTNLIGGFKKFPNFIFSTSMGIIWIMPTVVFLLYVTVNPKVYFRNLNKIKYLSFLLYIFGCFIVLFIWQGKDVSYGQRLLIGLLPFSFVVISSVKIKYQKIFGGYFILLYTSYLYFYSPNLTLEKGTTLWGTVVDFAPTNYFSNLFAYFYQVENILYILLKNIYAINFIKFTGFQNSNFAKNIFTTLPEDSYTKLIELINIYSNVETIYLISVNLVIFIFLYLLIEKIIFKKETIIN